VKKLQLFTIYVLYMTHSVQQHHVNPLTPELNPTAQRCLTRIFIGDFDS
jgi:hypothetical protein